jgi:hypothetical protein
MSRTTFTNQKKYLSNITSTDIIIFNIAKRVIIIGHLCNFCTTSTCDKLELINGTSPKQTMIGRSSDLSDAHFR